MIKAQLCLLTLLVFALSAGAYAAAPAGEPDLILILPDQVPLEVRGSPPLPAKKLSSVTLRVTQGGASPWQPIAFDAEMPAHKHGMVVAPSSPRALTEAGLYEVLGVKLHMVGAWEVKVKVKHAKSGEEQWINRSLLVK